jgi:cobalt-zinc-cadmium efflux system membrane fusion protein
LILYSPIAGEIVKDRILIGQYIKENDDALAVVANLDKVWIKAQVKEKDIPLINGIESVTAKLTAIPDQSFNGKIFYKGNMLSEETRSIDVVIECDNLEHRMKPNMYAVIRFTDAAFERIVVSNSAILQDEGQRLVIVCENRTAFRKQRIEVLSSDEKQTCILSGIKAGDKIVTEGAFYFIEAL